LSTVSEIAALVRAVGYAFKPALEPEKSAVEIAHLLGTIANIGSGTAHPIVPKARHQSTPNSYSGIFGTERFPPHTDLAHWREPPRYVVLRCTKGYREVTTNLIDGTQVLREVDDEAIARAIVQPRRPQKGLVPMFKLYRSTSTGVGLLRWDENFLRPANQTGAIAMAMFKEALDVAPTISVALCNYGDTLIFDNWRMLHSRGEVPAACMNRKIERIYLEAQFEAND